MTTSGFVEFQRLQRKMNGVTFLINALGAMTTFFYLQAIDPPPRTHSAVNPIDTTYAIIFALTLVLTLVLGTVLGASMRRQMNQWYQDVVSGERTPEELPERARQRILNYPLYSAEISAAMWAISGIIFTVLTLSYRMLIGIVAVGGLFSVVVSYLAGELIWRPVLPFFFPDGRVSTVRSFRLTVLGRLLLSFLFIGILPPALLVMLSLQRARLLLSEPNPEALLENLYLVQGFILGFGIIVSVGLAILITKSITHPLNMLREAMGRVRKNDLSAQVAVVSNDELGYLSEHFNQMVEGLRQGEMLRNILNVYVSPEVASEALAHGTKLGGELIECTALFSDIRGFTSIAETLSPDALMSLLNRYMSMMIEVILENGGMVNKFGGDSILALFGTPLNPAEAHAEKAVFGARAMLRALENFNREQESKHAPTLDIGIGIATGPAVAGNIGGEQRLEYTVIGDTINLASRLEEKTKEIEGKVLMSEETYRRASQSLDFQARRLDISVKGKRQRVIAYVLETEDG